MEHRAGLRPSGSVGHEVVGDLYDFVFQVVKVSRVNHIIVHVKTNKQMWLPQPNKQRLYHTIKLQHGIYWGNSRGHIFYSVLTKLGPHFVHTSGILLISKLKCQRSRSHLNFNHVLVFILVKTLAYIFQWILTKLSRHLFHTKP